MEHIVEIKGLMRFVFEGKETFINVLNYDGSNPDGLDKFRREKEFYGDPFSGEEFLESVKDGCIMDYDGNLTAVLIDGYLSNLGLHAVEGRADFSQGHFLVSPEYWHALCKEHDITVYWANK